MQIWNEDIELLRRYVIVQVVSNNVVTKVKVVTGNTLAQLDTTGTLTQKYQARMILSESKLELITAKDTEFLQPAVRSEVDLRGFVSPISDPKEGQILPIGQVFERLQGLIGESFPEVGYDQERNRGAILHRMVCDRLARIFHRFCVSA